MTTVLVTKDYILADRLVDYAGTVKELPKPHFHLLQDLQTYLLLM